MGNDVDTVLHEVWKLRSKYNVRPITHAHTSEADSRAIRDAKLNLYGFDRLAIDDPRVWEEVDFAIQRYDRAVLVLAPHLSFGDFLDLFEDEKRLFMSFFNTPARDISRAPSWTYNPKVNINAPTHDEPCMDKQEVNIDAPPHAEHEANLVTKAANTTPNSDFVEGEHNKYDEPHDGECVTEHMMQIDVIKDPLVCSDVEKSGLVTLHKGCLDPLPCSSMTNQALHNLQFDQFVAAGRCLSSALPITFLRVHGLYGLPLDYACGWNNATTIIFVELLLLDAFYMFHYYIRLIWLLAWLIQHLRTSVFPSGGV